MTGAWRFRYELVRSLPALSWVADICRGSPVVKVRHGASVVCAERFFFEGAWPGHLATGGFADDPVCNGSGIALTDSGVVIASPTHTLERLYFLRRRMSVTVSNSLPLLLAATASELRLDYWDYTGDIMSLMLGIDRGRRTLPLGGNRQVEMLFYSNAEIDANLVVHRRPKKDVPAPNTYSQYRALLERTLAHLRDNARDPARPRTYELLATVSSGYDSPAVAALGRTAGCGRALTFTHARTPGPLVEDSGAPVAAALGMRLVEADRLDYLLLPDSPEAEFLAAGMGGEEVVFASVRDQLAGSMLLTGYLGDTVWSTSPWLVNDTLRMLFPGGGNLGEFRQVADFVHVPVPFIGYRHHKSILDITRSDELRPWSVGGDYDRPIARRLAEEAGVPRLSFGQRKLAVTQPLWQREIGASSFTRETFEALQLFSAQCSANASHLTRLRFAAMQALLTRGNWLVWRVEHLARKFGRPIDTESVIAARYLTDEGPQRFGFHWATALLTARRAEALRASNDTPACDDERVEGLR